MISRTQMTILVQNKQVHIGKNTPGQLSEVDKTFTAQCWQELYEQACPPQI